MSQFLANARKLAGMLDLPPKTRTEAQQMELGRTWAVELIDALRNGDKTPALLAAGILLSGKNQPSELMAGFIDELSQAIVEGIR
jgi:hypothetical protein